MIHKLTEGLLILAAYAVGGDLAYVPNSYPNGTPNHPARCYVSVEIGNQWVSDGHEGSLRRLGWVPEQDGQVWVFYY